MTEALKKHEEWQGKIEVISRVSADTKEQLAIAYTPGVAEPCLKIAENEEDSYRYTRRGNLVAVITDGSAVLGLGNIGGLAGMPVMEGKAALFKEYGGVDAFPICLKSQDADSIVTAVTEIAGSFGGINLEDISAPRCFEIEERIQNAVSIPVFHDDQHGTAIVCAAGLINALKLADKKIENVTAVISGAGAAGTAVAKLLINMNIGDVIICGRNGIVSADSASAHHRYLAALTNKKGVRGTLEKALIGADVFIGVSAPDILKADNIGTMAKKPIIFAMSNPKPEINPDAAKAGGAYIVGTGRSDYPNQINNVLAFPGVFKGALMSGATRITEGMKTAAVRAIADAVGDRLCTEYVIPDATDKSVALKVAEAVAAQAEIDKVTRKIGGYSGK